MAALTLSADEVATLRSALEQIKTASREAVQSLHLPEQKDVTFTIPELVVIGALVEACLGQFDERASHAPAIVEAANDQV
jgi:hypothetical protein